MAEFSLDLFTKRLRDVIYNSFPYEREELNLQKHEDRLGHIRDVAFKNNETIILDENTLVFDIGNTYAEERYPYYHILQDAPYIRKRGRATAKTRGSQARVEYVGARDYNAITWNGKTYSREYQRNVRGKRSRLSKVSHWATDYNGNKYFINREANTYLNVHYKYIENIMNFNLMYLAIEFGLKQKRTELTDLSEDYGASRMLNIFNSFEE